ncbi:hypothetical protein ACFUTU_04580 [Arthrobacter sp. NPDC057388]|uniref:hypothetical protein n=1 Tax=Arthrobacter sp. NPDC057388 TaxID=3346116 RepID=UPI00362B0874
MSTAGAPGSLVVQFTNVAFKTMACDTGVSNSTDGGRRSLSLPKTCRTAVLPQLEPAAWFGSRTHPKNFLNSAPQMLDQPFIVSPSWQTVVMEVLGNPAAEAGAPHGVTALAAAGSEADVPDALFPDAVFRWEAVPGGWSTGEVFPFDDESAAGGFVYDDYLDAVVPEDPFPGGEYDDCDLPEDPFPEALFYGTSFTGGEPTGADVPRLGLGNRVGAVKTLLRADLTADGPGLIDQTALLEKFKHWATGQQARLAVEFEARQRQEQAEPEAACSTAQTGHATLSAEELGRKRPKEPCWVWLSRSPWPGVSHRTAAAGCWAWPKPSSSKCPTPSPPWIPAGSAKKRPCTW